MKAWFEKGELAWQKYVCYAIDGDEVCCTDGDFDFSDDENPDNCSLNRISPLGGGDKRNQLFIKVVEERYGIYYKCNLSTYCDKCELFAKQYPGYLYFEIAAIVNLEDKNATVKKIESQRTKKPCYQDAIEVLERIDKNFDWDTSNSYVKRLIYTYNLQWLKDNRGIILKDIKPFICKFEKGDTITSDEDKHFHNAINKAHFISFYTPHSEDDFKRNLRCYLNNAQSDIDLNWIDTSQITDMSNLFSGLYYFNGDISKWDVSNVTNMECMFKGCAEFDCDISKWNVEKVENMDEMFYGCLAFNQDIKQWNVSNVKKKHNVFRCSGICDKFNPLKNAVPDEHLANCQPDCPSFSDIFDEFCEIEDNNTDKSGVGKHSKMWYVLNNLPINYHYFDIADDVVINSLESYFRGDWCDDRFVGKKEESLKQLYMHIGFILGDFKSFIDKFEKGELIKPELAKNFYEGISGDDSFVCFYIPSSDNFKKNIRLYLQNADANVNLNWISTYHITDMSNLFSGLYYFNGDISQWDVSNVTNMEGMFEGCVEFDGDLSGWAINENTRTVNMFRLCGIDDDNKPKMK